MNFALTRFIVHLGLSCEKPRNSKSYGFLLLDPQKWSYSSAVIPLAQKTGEELLVVVGGGAAGVYGAIRAKTVAPHLNVLLIEKGKLLSKVKISGGGRCNVTNGHCTENRVPCDKKLSMMNKEYCGPLESILKIEILAEHYPRGHRELKGSFFSMHGPADTMTWFSEHGVKLKTEDDGRVFPISDSSSSIIDCLLYEAKQKGVLIQTGKVVTSASRDVSGNFLLKIEKRTTNYVENLKAVYLLIASGSSRQGYVLATQLGHSIVDPVPSLFTFKIEDSGLAELSGVSFPKVRVKLKLENVQTNIPQLTQVGPMLVTHWGLSGPAILRLSSWGARHLFSSNYEGDLFVDFVPDIKMEDVKSILMKQKHQFTRQKLLNACPSEFGIVKRFWKYILNREGVDADILWASISNNSVIGIASMLKQCKFRVMGKGQFKDEFVTAGGVPLSEISLSTMESKIQPHLFFAGEVLNVDGVTGGFNFQNAWSGGYIAGTSIGKLALDANMKKEVRFGAIVEQGKTPS